jgi:hypothetical protein
MAPAAPALAKKHIHSVWCPNETGTLIGGTGRWIDVDDNGNIVSNTGVKSTTGFSSLEKVSLQWEAAPRYNGSTHQKPAKLAGQWLGEKMIASLALKEVAKSVVTIDSIALTEL